MLVVTQRVDIRDAIARGQDPVAVIRRKKATDADSGRVAMLHGQTFDSAEWQTLQGRIFADNPLEIGIDKGKTQDGLISVPLFSYTVKEATAEILVTLGLQLGTLICLQRPESAQQLTIVQGNVFNKPGGEEGYQVWLGFAFKLRRNV